MRKNTTGRVSQLMLALRPKQETRKRVWKILNIVVVATMVANVSLLGSLVRPKAASAAAASIWTTQETCLTPADQDANEYANGETVYVRGKNWDPDITVYGQIHGNPGGSSADPSELVASFQTTTTDDQEGYFCATAYVVGSDGDLDDGVYTVDVWDNDAYEGGSKNDNYHVNGVLFGSITVSKEIDTDGNGTFEGGDTEGNSAGFRWGVDQDPADREFGTTLADVTADDYDISENSQNGYHVAGWYDTNGDGSCNNPDGNSLPASISVSSNEDTAVTICNARNVYNIQVDKRVVPLEGEDLWNPEGWTWSVDGGTNIEGGDWADVLGGVNHTIIETPDMFQAPGYTTTWQCSVYEERGFIGSGEGRIITTDELDFGADHGDSVYCRFTNSEVPTYDIHGQKFNDLNGNGTWDEGELGLNGWTIFLDTNQNGVLDGEEQSLQTKSDDSQDGWYVFHGLPAGTYQVCEVQKGGWTQTYPANDNNNCHSMTVGGELINREPLNTCNTQETQNSILAPSCNFGNTRDTGTIELKKVWSGTPGQTTLNIGTTVSGSQVISQPTGTAGATPLTTGIKTVGTGTYYVSETGGLTDYSSTLACTDNDSPVTPGTDNAVAVTKGHAVVCTFTNTKNVTAITLDKTGPATATPGQSFTYTLSWSVAGNTSATNAVITDPIPANTTFASQTCGTTTGTCATSFASGVAKWELGTRNPGESGTVTMTVIVSPSLTSATSLTNTGTFKTDQNVSFSSNLVTTTVTVPTLTVTTPRVLGVSAEAKLGITKSVNTPTANPGDTVTYTIVVSNTGDANATSVVVTDNLPDGFTFVDGGKATKTWNIGALAAGASQTLTYQVKVGKDVAAGEHVNRAFVTADFFDPIAAEAIVNVKIPQVLGLADTGAGLKDLITFVLGIALMAAGFIGFQQLRRRSNATA